MTNAVSKRSFESVDYHAGLLPFEPTEGNVDQYFSTLALAGVDYAQVNHLPDLMHPEMLNQPDNVYLWFANFGAPLDLFVSSDLNEGLYPRLYLERNLKSLLRLAESARRHGIKPILYLCEPRFVPERFFQRHPALRGPRVDNPTCSRSPLFALCTDLPEVRAHYRQMLGKIIDAVPDLAGVVLFTSDSGSGFDYNPHTYAGANGAGFNAKFPLEKRALRFLSALLEAGRERNPQFTVSLTSGLPVEVREKVCNAAPDGVTGSVYGAMSWTGGLEEQWAYQQKRFDIAHLDRKAARQERLEDMRSRLAAATTRGQHPRVHIAAPTYEYLGPVTYVPHPYETIDLLQSYHALGVKKLSLWGPIYPPNLVPNDANLAAMLVCFDDIALDADSAVLGIARQWVGEKLAPVLAKAWRMSNDAITHRPLWTHCFGAEKQFLPGPLVPDLHRLSDSETRYYRGAGQHDMERIAGRAYFVPHESNERNRDYVLKQCYEAETLPLLRDAVKLLDEAASIAPEPAAAVLAQQRDHIEVAYLIQRSHYNWFEAGRYIVPGADAGHDRSMRQIVHDEISGSRRLHALIDGCAEKFIQMFWSDHMMYHHGPSFPDFLLKRIALMEKHADDEPRNLSSEMGKMHQYLKDLG